MLKNQYPAAISLLRKTVKAAEGKEEHLAAAYFIDHTEAAFFYFRIDGKEDDFADLRQQLQNKADEATREQTPIHHHARNNNAAGI